MGAATGNTVLAEEGASLPAVTNSVIDEVVAELGALHRATGINYAYAVGKLVLERFYGSDLELTHYQGPKVRLIRVATT